ncbi:MAG: AAA family ATPase, partial [Candidatus Omnitrophica bacterium]|nr:AAA family ATPase [Candidatus Omnitrophota bacterium]
MLGKTVSNRYKITEEVTQDNLTVLYKAQDTAENKPVFVRFLKEKTKQRPLETLLRFKRLQDQLSRLSHPNLSKILSQGEFEGADYVVKEYSDSILLSSFLKQPQNISQPIQIDTTVDIILQISSALDLVHQNSILHQSISPQSVFVTPDLKTVKLTNFGNSLLNDISKISEPDEIISTFGYLSPESSGILRKPIDVRSDIYSLGVLFYQLVSGRLPYLAQDVSTLIHQHIAQVPDPPVKINSQIPSVIENIVLRLIAKDPQDRYQSLTGLIADLKEYRKQKAEGKVLIDFEIARFDKLRQLDFSTRLIGRDKELDQLKALLDQAEQGKGNLSFVFGEPGIGKSRLVDELRGCVHGVNGIFCGGKCYQYDLKTPYKVFSEAIDAFIDKIKRLPQDEQQSRIKRIKDNLGELGGEVVKIAPAIVDLIGKPPKLTELEAEKEKIRFLIAITNFLTYLSTPDSPLLMFLDDLQWADDGSFEILERFAEKLHNSSVILIISYRDTEVGKEHPLAQLVSRLKEKQVLLYEMPIRSFGLRETSQMISQIIMEKEDAVLPLAQELNERTKGNPFFTLELLHSLFDSRVVYLMEDHYTYDLEKLKNANLPTTIVEAVLKRMKDLSEESLKILSYGSVMGKEIQFSLLVDLTHQSQDQVLGSIENGIHNQLLYRDLTGEENIFFVHDRIREAFYQRVSGEERAPLHKHIAELLEARNKGATDNVLYDLAYHFTQGKVEDKALQYCIPAGHKAKSAYASMLAIDLYVTAKQILEKQGKDKSQEYIEVLESLGQVYRLAARFEESMEALGKCNSLIPAQNKFYKAQVLSAMGDTLFAKGELENSVKVLEQALRVLGVAFFSSNIGVILGITKEFFRQMLHTWFPKVFVSDKRIPASGLDIFIVRTYLKLAHIYYCFDMSRTLYFWLKSLNFTEKKGPSPDLAYNYASGGPTWATFPWFSRAFRDLDKGLKMSQELGDKIVEGVANAYIAYTYYFANRPKEGLAAAQRAINLLKIYGEYWGSGVGYAFRIDNDLVTGNLNLNDCYEYLAIAREAKALQILGWALLNKVKMHCALGNVDGSVIDEIKEARVLMKETRDAPNEVYTISILAWAYSRMGKHKDAVIAVEEASKLFFSHFNLGPWILDNFNMGAQVCLDAVSADANLSAGDRRRYLKLASWLICESHIFSFLYKFFYGWTLQVNGTYLWLTGRKKKAVRTWDKALHWLRTNKGNPGGDKYRIAYILLEQAKFLLSDKMGSDPIIRKKAYSNLIEARDLFTEMGCKLDLDTTNKLLESISPEGISVDSRTVLTQKRHLDSLLSVTQAIGSIFILDELLQKILEYGLKVTGAERGFLLLYDQAKNLSLKVSSNLEKDLQGLSFSYENYKLSLELINEVQNSKAAVIAGQDTASTSKISNELKTFSVKQAIAVPLQTRDKPIGILYMDNRLAGGTFGKDELELMKGFAVQASVSIENAFLVSSLVEQERLKQELELGRQIQESLLPKESPVIQGLKLSGLMLPAKEIGGDYYDFVTP